jgi:hypothetical protein
MKKILFHAVCVLGIIFAVIPMPSIQATIGVMRFVSMDGEDSGDCTSMICQTIAYAVGQATSGDTIRIGTGTFPVTLNLTKNLIFQGQGMNSTILSGGDASRVMLVNLTYTVSLLDLTITGGYSEELGGGIRNAGTVNLTRVKVIENIAQSGGGIYTFGPMYIMDSEISENIAEEESIGKGGGIVVNPDAGELVQLERVTISGNTATDVGGGIHSQGSAGSSLSLKNVTLSTNFADRGGGMNNSSLGSVTVLNSTIVNNSATNSPGGILNYGTISFKNTLVAGNTPNNCWTGGINELWSSEDYNLDSGSTCHFILPHDLQDSPPRIGPLADNGGYSRTHALLMGNGISIPNSPAINAGTESGCPFEDQRGLERPFGMTCDIGAYEYTDFYISGNAGIAGATLTYFNVVSKTATADGTGHYSFPVPSWWTGTVTPSLNGYKFTPVFKSYTNLWTEQFNQDYSYSNPVPVLSSISPSSKWAGRPAQTITVFGTKFTPDSIVRWNGSDRVTTFINPGKLTVVFTMADMATAAIASVTVFNPVPTGGNSVTREFTVKNEVPSINSLSPSSKTHGKATFTLTVFGAKFGTGAVVRWNGEDRPTTWINQGKLTATIYASDIASVGVVSVTVFNPAPFGGESYIRTFGVN